MSEPTQSWNWPPLYTPFKLTSLRLAPVLRDSWLSSNALTISWALLLVGAAVAIALERPWLALLLVMPAIFLDCLDGDLARSRGRASTSGTYVEQIAHWLGNMALVAGAGAAVLLADPSPRHVLLASALPVVQSIYVAVVRQVRPDAADVPEQPRLVAVFRAIIKGFWYLSPIELPLLAAMLVFGVTPGVVLGITVVLAVSSVVIFVPHFLLVRAVDRRHWAMISALEGDSLSQPWDRYARALVAQRFPDACWWTPGAPQLPPGMLALMGRQPMAWGAPVLASAWRDLQVLLPQLFRTQGRVLMLACPIDAAWEAVLRTLGLAGDELLVIGSRATIQRRRALAERLGLRVAGLELPFGGGLDVAELDAALARAPELRIVWVSQADTDDGTCLDLGRIRERIGAARWLCVDASSSLCADDLHMDAWGIDVVVSSSNSGLMGPPGVSLVAVAGRALAALSQPDDDGAGGGYLDLRAHLGAGDRPLAPLPTPVLAGLVVAVELILAVGLDGVIAHRRQIAEVFRRGCVERAGLTLVAEGTAACTVVLLPGDVALGELRGRLFASMQMVVGSGLTPEGGVTLQVGHAGWVFEEDVERALEVLAAGVRDSRLLGC